MIINVMHMLVDISPNNLKSLAEGVNHVIY